MALTAKQQRFVAEYLVDLNATQAAIRAGYSARTAGAMGHENLTKPEISAAVAAAQLARSQRTQVTADQVLADLARVAFGDVRKLVQYRRTACRHCHGKGFGWQHTDVEAAEKLATFERAKARHERRLSRAKPEDDVSDPPEAPDLSGGTGWDPRRPPNQACPHCLGDGRARVVITDTRNLDPDALSLYEGVEETKDGLRVRIASRDRARELIGKHLGMFVDKVEHSGEIGLADRLARARERVKAKP